MSTRVLVVEDDPQIRQLLVRVLELENLETTTAPNGVEGWRRLNESRFDLVISDRLTPELDGRELARRARERYGRAVKFILLSSRTDVPRPGAGPVGVDAFLPKSFAVRELIHITRDLLGLPPRSGTVGSADY